MTPDETCERVWEDAICSVSLTIEIPDAVSSTIRAQISAAPKSCAGQARRVRDGRVSARLLAIANALAGVDRQILRDWVRRYNAEGMAGLVNRRAPGRQPKLSEGQMVALWASDRRGGRFFFRRMA